MPILDYWMKNLKWILLATLSVAGIILGVVFKSLFTTKDNSSDYRIPEAPKPLQEKVAKAKEEAHIAKVQASDSAEDHKRTLDEISNIEDDKVRRDTLAKLAASL